jgi:hypothetical protein
VQCNAGLLLLLPFAKREPGASALPRPPLSAVPCLLCSRQQWYLQEARSRPETRPTARGTRVASCPSSFRTPCRLLCLALRSGYGAPAPSSAHRHRRGAWGPDQMRQWTWTSGGFVRTETRGGQADTDDAKHCIKHSRRAARARRPNLDPTQPPVTVVHEARSGRKMKRPRRTSGNHWDVRPKYLSPCRLRT